jgi:hypothetical protein
MYKIIAFFIITLFTWLYMRVGILLTHGTHLHDCIISLRRVVKAHTIRLTPQFSFPEVSVPSQENEQLCICVSGVSILPLSTILIFYFGIVPTVWYFLFFLFYY